MEIERGEGYRAKRRLIERQAGKMLEALRRWKRIILKKMASALKQYAVNEPAGQKDKSFISLTIDIFVRSCYNDLS